MARAKRAGTPRRCAAFTLIEVMIALLLVLALSVVAWASLSPLRDRVAMDEASLAVASGIDQARSLAASRNEVLEVRASIEPGVLEIQARSVGAQVERSATTDEDAAAWAVLTRLEGAFEREDPEASAGGAESGEAGDEREIGGMAREAEYVAIGVVLPDGSMVPGVPLRLRDMEGRWSTIRVGTWTTRVEVEAPAAADASAEDGTAEPESMEPVDGLGDGSGDGSGDGLAKGGESTRE